MNDYVIVYDQKRGYALPEHRRVMEDALGRHLRYDELVHHKDGDKANNALENLQVVTAKEHAALHPKTPRKGKRGPRPLRTMVTLGIAARLAGTSRATVARWIKTGHLPAFKTPGGQWRVRRVDLERVKEGMGL